MTNDETWDWFVICHSDFTVEKPDLAVAIQGLFETHLTVKSLDRSIAFYRDTLGLELAYMLPERRVAFFWLGGYGTAMLGLWEVGDGPNALRLHFAFKTSVEEMLQAPEFLKSKGLIPTGFGGNPLDEPFVFGWMPALSLYFRDPDGHSLEYLAMLPEPPRPDLGIVSYRDWLAKSPKS